MKSSWPHFMAELQSAISRIVSFLTRCCSIFRFPVFKPSVTTIKSVLPFIQSASTMCNFLVHNNCLLHLPPLPPSPSSSATVLNESRKHEFPVFLPKPTNPFLLLPPPSMRSSISAPVSPLKNPRSFSSLSHLLPLLPLSSKSISFKLLCSPNPSPPLDPDPVPLLQPITAWADEIKERGMRQRRLLYTHDQWRAHRSSLRHLRHLLSSLSSRVILSLVPPVLVFTTVATVVAAYNTAAAAHWLPGPFPVLRASSLPYQLTAPALALLLVFRTEASYSRFEEGRKVWARVMIGTADFAREVIAGVKGEMDAPLKDVLLKYIMAFPLALKCHVIYGSDAEQDLKHLLEEDDLGIITRSKHRPRCIIEFISQSLQLLHVDESKRHTLESKISCFHEGIGACEQLMGIPIPLSYTRLTSRFLVLWHLTLPIILWDDCNWIVVPATFISAASLFCIEEVGVLIEEPFPMLALDELCNLVHESIQEAIDIESLVKGQLLSKSKIQSQECPTNNGRPPNT